MLSIECVCSHNTLIDMFMYLPGAVHGDGGSGAGAERGDDGSGDGAVQRHVGQHGGGEEGQAGADIRPDRLLPGESRLCKDNFGDHSQGG